MMADVIPIDSEPIKFDEKLAEAVRNFKDAVCYENVANKSNFFLYINSKYID